MTSSYYHHKANELMERLLEFAHTKMRVDKRFDKLVTSLRGDGKGVEKMGNGNMA
jgi:hypothetical protein